jgi:undecaprenyl-diphosphatase
VRELDLRLFRSINEGPDWLEPIMVFLSLATKLWYVDLALLLLFIYFIWHKPLRTPALLAMVSWPVANAACDWVKYGLQMPRPCVELTDVVLRVPLLTSFGTASAHAANMMAVAVAFLFYNWRLGTAWLVVALATGYSRVYVGVHYPYQVLFGWALGALVAFVAVKTWEAYRRTYRSQPQESE